MSRLLILERYCYSETETEGRLLLADGQSLYTLERPWIAGLPGGMPFESCVPDGEYELLEHRRSNGDQVYALRNPDCAVFYTQDEKGEQQGRYKILIHAANWVDQIHGCIAPGMVRTISSNKRMVGSSRLAMRNIMQTGPYERIIIRPALGT